LVLRDDFDQSAFAIEDVGARKGDGLFVFRVEAAKEKVYITRNLAGDTVSPRARDKGDFGLLAGIIRRNQEQNAVFARDLFLELRQSRQFLNARHAPCGPEVHDHNFSFIARDFRAKCLGRHRLDNGRSGENRGLPRAKASEKRRENAGSFDLHGASDAREGAAFDWEVEIFLVRQDAWRSRMPVVLYHRKAKQKESLFSWKVNRWYKTTGIRLRQASCRTRKISTSFLKGDHARFPA